MATAPALRPGHKVGPAVDQNLNPIVDRRTLDRPHRHRLRNRVLVGDRAQELTPRSSFHLLLRCSALKSFMLCDQKCQIAPDEVAVKARFRDPQFQSFIEINTVTNSTSGRR